MRLRFMVPYFSRVLRIASRMPRTPLARACGMCFKSSTYASGCDAAVGRIVTSGRQPSRQGGQAFGGLATRPRSRALLIRDIVRYGDPRLTAENAEVNAASENISGLLADMVETCHAAPGVGLAAPQIGVNKKVAIIDLSVGAD